MNELRMYVEHLFEGRVLTAENIELKEEIYGNMVARYEDLLEDGLSAEEALRRTKESFTSVDDVLAEEGAEHVSLPEADASIESVVPLDDSDQPTATSDPAVTHGYPTPVTESGSAVLHPQPSQSVERRRIWPLVLISVVGIIIVLLVGLVGCNMVRGIESLGAFTVNQGDSVSIDESGVHVQGGGSTVDVTPDGGVSVYKEDSGVVVDANGRVYLDGDVADELTKKVVNASSNDVLTYVNSSLGDVDGLGALLINLPMGEWSANLDVTRGSGVLRFDYLRVPDYVDGGSIDLALAYNATVLFCVVPDVQEIQVTLTESDDPHDADYYVFKRAAVEEMYGVSLNADMVNEAGWDQLKRDNLYKHDVAEHIVDRAESAGQ